ncbi:hypothetical protein GQ53DRAFT_840577 [Thozetella sp. PMI_491]|nr:hypothetical protein GQ53DRAFT_840577 [Thozetella sp. PMI_491]
MSWDSKTWVLLQGLFMGATVIEAVAVPFSPISDAASASSNVPSTTSHIPSTITSAASLPPWGTLPVPLNTCSYTSVDERNVTATLWNEPWCSLAAGTVQLHFWPTIDNKTYPATVYNSELDYTFTSPSVYMIINTLHASNECGPLGPAPTSAIFAFDLTDVSTLVPFTDATAHGRMTSRQLELNDLDIGCSQSFDMSQIQTQTYYTEDDAHRCNPRLAIPRDIKRYGYPYWKHCGHVGERFGLFDPPFAFPPGGGSLLSSTESIGSTAVSTTDSAGPTASPPATTLPTPSTELAPSTSAQVSLQPTISSPAPPAGSASTTPTVVSTHDSASSPAVIPSSTEKHDDQNGTPSQPPTATGSHSDQNGTTSLSPPPPASITTVSRQVVSLGPSGVVVVNEDGTNTPTTSTYIVPAFGATGQGSDVQQASVVVYHDQTLTLGGPAATISDVVVVLPTGSATSKPFNVVTAAAPRTMTGGLLGLILSVVTMMCLHY